MLRSPVTLRYLSAPALRGMVSVILAGAGLLGSALPLVAQTVNDLRLGLLPVPSLAGRWQLSWQSLAGVRYRLERSPNLQAETWTEVTALTEITATAPTATFTDPQPLSGPRSF